MDKIGDFDFALRAGDKGFLRTKFTKRPDFSGTYSKLGAGSFVDGYLVLAIEEKNPATDDEKNFVRVIGLSVETE
jgi:hypothetical protein